MTSRVCEECGAEFNTRHPRKRFCQPRCSWRNNARRYRAEHPVVWRTIASRCYERKITRGLDGPAVEVRRLLREWRREQARIALNETCVCQLCGLQWSASRRDVWVGRTFCSTACSFKAGALVAADHKRTWNDPRRECLHCGRTFVTLRDRGYVRNPKHTKGYCSRQCGVLAFHERRRLTGGLSAKASPEELRAKKNEANRKYRERVRAGDVVAA